MGVGLGLALNISYPTAYSFYITMGLLAAMDSVLGALRSYLEGKYSNVVPLYYAVILVFGGRLFQNLAAIRHIIIDRWPARKESRRKIKTPALKNSAKQDEKNQEKSE